MSTWFRRLLALLLLVFLGLGVAFSVTRPFAAGSDEVAHFQFTRFIAGHGRLPVTELERSEAGYKSDWPPLFHLLVGLAGTGIDLSSPPFVKSTEDNPRLLLVVGLENILGWRAITTEDPFRSEVLLWYLGRWMTLISGAVGVGVTYLLLRTFYPAHPWLALSGAAVLAFLPTYVEVSSVISYEPLLGVWLAFYFFLLFATLRQPNQNWPYLVLGLLLGLAMLTKYTPFPALPLLPLLVLWLAYQNHWPWRTTGWRLALVGLGLALPLGSWLLYTEIYFNQVARLGWVNGLLSPFLVSDGSDETSLRLAGLISGGQIGLAGSGAVEGTLLEWAWRMVDSIAGGGWLTWLLFSLWVVAGAGLIRQWFYAARFGQSSPPENSPPGLEPGPDGFNLRLWFVLVVAHLGLLMVLPLVRFLLTGELVTGMGQHFLFPAAAILTLLLVQGLSAWFTPTRLTAILLLVAGACLVRSTATLVQDYTPPWPIQTIPLAEKEPFVAAFGPVSLLSYRHEADAQILRTTLQWRAEALASEDYRLELTLLDGQGQPQARWLGQPFNGRYPTRAWLSGDRLRDQLTLPIAGLPPGDYQVQLRWLAEAGPVAPATAKAGGHASSLPVQAEVNSLPLGQVTLGPSAPETVEMVQLHGQNLGYTLWPQQGAGRNLPLYEENATIVVSTSERLPEEVHLSLIGPDGQPRAAVDHTGLLYNFLVEPHFAGGEYHLRFEQWAGTEVVDQVDTAPLLQVQTQARQFQPGPLAHPLQANFADQVALLGYDLPERRVQPGGSLAVTLHWQALKTIGADLIMFNHLVNKNQEIWGGRDRRAQEVYSTMLWASGEIVKDSFEVQVRADAPEGIYTLLVGLYLPVGQAPVSLPLLQEGRMSDLTNVSLGLIKVGTAPPGFVLPAVQPQHPLNQSFGDAPNLTLLGYDLERDNCQQSTINPTGRLRTCQLSIKLYWRSEAPLPLDYTTFVHLRNTAGETVAQQDQPPLNGSYPTSLWDPGEILADEMTVSLPTDLPAGTYQLVAGLYDFNTGQRLAVPGHVANEVSLTRVEVH